MDKKEQLREIIKYQIEAYGGKINPKDDFNGFILDILALFPENGGVCECKNPPPPEKYYYCPICLKPVVLTADCKQTLLKIGEEKINGTQI